MDKSKSEAIKKQIRLADLAHEKESYYKLGCNLEDVTYQLLRSTDGRFGSSSTVLNDGLGEVLEIASLQPALEMLAMLNENAGKGIIYKLRGVKIKKNK